MSDQQHLDSSRGWINTTSGLKFYPLNPEIEKFRISDQAISLSNKMRYNGHAGPYSVAAHALLVYFIVTLRAKREGLSEDAINDLGKRALVHDNAEAYLGDMPHPLKQLPEYAWFRELEQRYEDLIAEWLCLSKPLVTPWIKQIDLEVCAYEAPLLYETLNLDWVFPERRALGNEYQKIKDRVWILALASPEDVKVWYRQKFTQLFGERSWEHYSR